MTVGFRMPSTPSLRLRRMSRWIAVAVGALAMAGWVTCASAFLGSRAGPEDVPTVDRRARELVAAIDTFVRDHGHPPSRLEELLPKYLDEIPAPLPGSQANFCYFTFPGADLSEGEWLLVFFCSAILDVDSAEAIEFHSNDHHWRYYPG